MAKAIALLSGGLDSTLAALIVLKQGIEVTAVTFMTHFGCDPFNLTDSSSCSSNPLPNALKFGFDVKLSHLADKFIDIVKNPKFGYGKNINPCIDCRILMLKEAKSLMENMGADFLITGEVLGQRPMSQRRATFPVIDKESDTIGLVLRPLTAKRLNPTMPEINGIIDRNALYDFHGRSRKPQIALAKELGLTEYPDPGGGCLLTEPFYAYRLNDLLKYSPDATYKEINLLKYGRHFRLSDRCKAVVGRNERENNILEGLYAQGDLILIADTVGSPATLLIGEFTDVEIRMAASITARYCDARAESNVKIGIWEGIERFIKNIIVPPALKVTLDKLRIEAR
ncbi:MAG: 7-cyano-7-deazaguanine synthase [Nitrospirae bacterium]|nr:7-cyano-7-deazaguanine synthase [Nitrospirota bacterium]